MKCTYCNNHISPDEPFIDIVDGGDNGPVPYHNFICAECASLHTLEDLSTKNIVKYVMPNTFNVNYRIVE